MHTKHRCDDWMRVIIDKIEEIFLKPYKGSYNFTTIINRLVLMDLHLYTGIGYGIVKLCSLLYVYGRHVYTHYRIYIMQNMKKTITLHRAIIKKNLKRRCFLRGKAFRYFKNCNKHIHCTSIIRKKEYSKIWFIIVTRTRWKNVISASHKIFIKL